MAARSGLSARDLQTTVSNAWYTVVSQAALVLSPFVIETTLALQPPTALPGGVIFSSRLGRLAIPLLAVLVAIAALSATGVSIAQRASARSRRLTSR